MPFVAWVADRFRPCVDACHDLATTINCTNRREVFFTRAAVDVRTIGVQTRICLTRARGRLFHNDRGGSLTRYRADGAEGLDDLTFVVGCLVNNREHFNTRCCNLTVWPGIAQVLDHCADRLEEWASQFHVEQGQERADYSRLLPPVAALHTWSLHGIATGILGCSDQFSHERFDRATANDVRALLLAGCETVRTWSN